MVDNPRAELRHDRVTAENARASVSDPDRGGVPWSLRVVHSAVGVVLVTLWAIIPGVAFFLGVVAASSSDILLWLGFTVVLGGVLLCVVVFYPPGLLPSWVGAGGFPIVSWLYVLPLAVAFFLSLSGGAGAWLPGILFATGLVVQGWILGVLSLVRREHPVRTRWVWITGGLSAAITVFLLIVLTGVVPSAG